MILGEPYPHMFIPRKLVCNGMLIWTMATYVEHPTIPNGKLPYFMMLVPHLKPNDGGGANAICTVIKVWPLERKPHIVADSGFGSFSLLTEIAEWGGTATLSIPTNECQKLDVLLSYNLPLNHWRAVINAKGFIFSISKKTVENASGGESIGKKCVVSNAFKGNILLSTSINIPLVTTGKIIKNLIIDLKLTILCHNFKRKL